MYTSNYLPACTLAHSISPHIPIPSLPNNGNMNKTMSLDPFYEALCYIAGGMMWPNKFILPRTKIKQQQQKTPTAPKTWMLSVSPLSQL